jgi:amino acid transporter
MLGFVREATGLVREVAGLEAFALNIGGSGPFLFSLAFTSFFVFVAVPGVDFALVIVLGGLFSIGVSLSYGLLSSSMPRSGGEYVFQSRILRPDIAFASEMVQFFIQSIGFAVVPSLLVVAWGLAPTLYQLGLLTGNSSYISLAATVSTPIWSTIIGTLYLVFVFVVGTLGSRGIFRYLIRVSFILALITMVAAFAVLLGNTPHSAVAAFDHFMTQYGGTNTSASQSILKSYVSQGFSVPITNSAGALLVAAGFTLGTGVYHWSSFQAGEVKHAGRVRNQMLQMVGSLAFSTAILAGLAYLLERDYGYDLIRAISVLSANSPSSIPGVAFSLGATTNYLIFVLVSNVPLLLLYFVGLLAMGLLLSALFVVLLSRLLFAMSFDRVLPSAVSDVSDRFHSPIKALTIAFISTWVFMILFLWTPFLQLLLTAAYLLAPIPIILVCLAALLFPIRQKAIYQNSPAKRYAPLLIFGGLLGLFYSLLASAAVLVTSTLLGYTLQHEILSVALYGIAVVGFYGIRAYRKRSGIDLSLLYRDIPPE